LDAFLKVIRPHGVIAQGRRLVRVLLYTEMQRSLQQRRIMVDLDVSIKDRPHGIIVPNKINFVLSRAVLRLRRNDFHMNGRIQSLAP